MTTKEPRHRQAKARERRRNLVYRVLWGNYAGYTCLPDEFREAVDQIAESPYLNFGRLAELIGESYYVPAVSFEELSEKTSPEP